MFKYLMSKLKYQPMVTVEQLNPKIFTELSELRGISMNEEGQLSLLETFKNSYKSECNKLNDPLNPTLFHFDNGRFETVDAEILYCMIRHLKPKRIIEIGAGYSSKVISLAILRNNLEYNQYHCDYTCIDISPDYWLYDMQEITNIINDKLENVPLSIFKELGENDILFIDSSHMINIYNDVCIEYLDIIPSLNTGVYVHSHDILLPQRYCQRWLNHKYLFNEQYLLQAFLSFNQSYSIVWASNFMHLKHSNKLHDAFISYNKLPGEKREWGHKSLWFKRVQ